MVLSDDLGGGRAYMCDVVNHTIDVTDLSARPLFSFGGRGSAPAQFEDPSDCVIVTADPAGEGATGDPAMLAVADRGNDRVQFFELDGALLGLIESSARPGALKGWPARSGWPFFRVAPIPPLVLPSRLDWRPPFLDVTTSGATSGATSGSAPVRVDLSTALLQDFETWLQFAPPSTLTLALEHFSAELRLGEIPDAYLWRMAERLRGQTAAASLSRKRFA
jgi:hypothetical protein